MEVGEEGVGDIRWGNVALHLCDIEGACSTDLYTLYVHKFLAGIHTENHEGSEPLANAVIDDFLTPDQDLIGRCISMGSTE